MKKTSLSILLLAMLFFAGCNESAPEVTNENIEIEIENQESSSILASIFGNRENTVSYKTAMQQPDFEDMENKDEIQSREFNKQWSVNYTLKKEDVETLKYEMENGYCENGVYLFPYETYGDDQGNSYNVQIPKNDLVEGKTFTVTGYYHGWNEEPLTGAIINQLKKYGFGIKEFINKIPNYQIQEGIYETEERVRNARTIGGMFRNPEYHRYPFNTLLITNDYLLHIFHKIFSNELQYFEESEARVLLTNIAKEMFTSFQKGEAGDNEELNNFLAAYWAIPYALLPDNSELIQVLREREGHMRENYANWSEDTQPQAEFSDEELKEYLTTRFTTILAQVDPKYQPALQEAWEEIRKAETIDKNDVLFMAFTPDFVSEYDIKQDYTQFRPRSHYTNSSFLKTYFMASKWLMREKFYIGDAKSAQAALYLAHVLTEKQELATALEGLQNKIRALVGSDDDITIQELNDFYVGELNSSLSNLGVEELDKLQTTTTKQRIASAEYITPEPLMTDEESAKDMLNGFIFIGEKFTIDSYIFDLLTAGSAEIEYLKKPTIQTALIVPDILEGNTLANELVHLRLTEKTEDSLVLEDEVCGVGENEESLICKQLTSYEGVKSDATSKIEKALNEDESLKTTIYHQWLNVLGQLFEPVENAPYFKNNPLYLLKNMTTYMSSYAELKHDTLLYAKQSYAEMGGGGGGDCSIVVYPPELPVPKGYIESDVNFLNQLIALNTAITEWFDNKDNFQAFGEYLEHIKDIAAKQMQNEVIADEEFERLRLSYQDLQEITYPRKLFGESSNKLERGAIIADIFTSMGGNPLYEAVGRPLLMALMVDDANGKRVVLGPIFSHYEFYKDDKILEGDARYSDTDWQEKYDNLTDEEKQKAYGIETRKLLEGLNK